MTYRTISSGTTISSLTYSSFGVITNYGVVRGGTGIELNFGGRVTNAAGGLIAGGPIAIYIQTVNPGTKPTVVNAGTVIGNGPTAIKLYYNWDDYKFGGVILNTGTIRAAGTGALGAYLRTGGLVQNYGTASVIAGYRVAVGMYGSKTGTVVNQGLIAGTGTAASYSGVALSGGGLVVNSGAGATINGEIAIFSHGSARIINGGTIAAATASGFAVKMDYGAAYVVADPGAVFVGTVSAGNGVLDLASGSSAGTLSGLGTQFVGFASAKIDANANWAFVGANSFSGQLTVTGTLTNLGSLSGNVTLAGGGALINGSGATLNGSVAGASTITNAGTLTNALNFTGGSSSRLVLGAGAAFGGTVGLGGGVLELGASSGVGTLSGLGTQIVQYAPLIAIDSGAAWHLGSSFGSGLTLVVGGTLSGGATLAAGAIISNTTTGTVSGGVAGSGTVLNSGTLVGAGGAGIGFTSGGEVTNNAGGQILGTTEGSASPVASARSATPAR